MVTIEFNSFQKFKNGAFALPTANRWKLHVLKNTTYVKIVYLYSDDGKLLKYVAAGNEIPVNDNWITTTDITSSETSGVNASVEISREVESVEG